MTRNIKEFVNHPRSYSTSPFPADVGEDHVCVLLALYNGARTLGAQLESIEAQSHQDWSIIISDDGSSDDWLPIVERFAQRREPGRTWVTPGPQQGYARNFLSLVTQAGPMVPYVAFCDQDDVWLKQKLARALSHLKTLPPGIPALYTGRTMICDDEMRQLRPSLLFKKPPTFGNALVQSIGGGNTMVLNRAALDLLQDTAPKATSIVSHDWWAYQLITGAGGTICYDRTPTVLYRQHDGNLVGANDTLLASLARLGRLAKGHFQDWNTANIAALLKVRPLLTPTAQGILDDFVAARSRPLIGRLCALKKSGVRRQTRRGTLALWLAAILNRL